MNFDSSDTILLSMAMAIGAVAITLELLRLVAGGLYGWLMGQGRMKAQTQSSRTEAERINQRLRGLSETLDAKNAERGRLKAQLVRHEATLAALDRERVEIWHEVGDGVPTGNLFVAPLENPKISERLSRDIDSDIRIWRYVNKVRVWASDARSAMQKARTLFPSSEGYAIGELRPAAQVMAKSTPQADDPSAEPSAQEGTG